MNFKPRIRNGAITGTNFVETNMTLSYDFMFIVSLAVLGSKGIVVYKMYSRHLFPYDRLLRTEWLLALSPTDESVHKA